MNRKSIAVMAIPTGLDLPPSAVVGVSSPMSGTINMHSAIPIDPTIKTGFLPNLSTVHVALRVKRIPKVAFKALMRFIVFVETKTFA
jgi:hypothetical protein